MRNRRIGITMGDPNGIGPEIILKFIKSSLSSELDYVIIGDRDCFEYYNKLYYSGRVKIVEKRFVQIKKYHFTVSPGKHNKIAGLISFETIKKAVQLIKQVKINAIVNCPVCKYSINQGMGRGSSGEKFTGHTEYYQKEFKVKNVVMTFLSEKLNVAVVTRHLPLRMVSTNLKEEDIIKTVRLIDKFLKKFKKGGRYRYCVLGLNPHSGEGGLMGNEEKKIIVPAINKLMKKYEVYGPVPPDTAFIESNRKKYDFFIAMYHDQGLIPIKTISLFNQCQITIGLPFLRLSVSHGNALDIAGKNKADPGSLIFTIKKAREILLKNCINTPDHQSQEHKLKLSINN